MISYGANLGLMVNAATGEIHDVALRGFLRGVDGLVQPNVKGYLTNTPPGSPSDGDVYIIGAAPTGAWAGNAGKVARWYANDGAWDFYTPKNGWMLQSNSAREVYRYTGGAWEIFYQEGTWTVSLKGLSGTAGAYAASIASGLYTKNGGLCYASFYLKLTNKGSWSGSTILDGLPFVVKSGQHYPPVTIGGISPVFLSTGKTSCLGYGNPGTQAIFLREYAQGAASDSPIPYDNISNSQIILGSLEYLL